jgi:asparagine synthase (glutamine-hydrolysing)
MCGIIGIIASERDVVAVSLRRATNALVHRGPDDSGHQLLRFGSQWLGLGHRRLSILDLSPFGHQPMAAGTSWVIFNGEIYNFAQLREELVREGVCFRSTGDTEVLLNSLVHWGTAALTRLQGMYAFGYFDSEKQRLLLARDPAGIKPLYLAKTVRGLIFGSEVRALLATGLISRKLDRRGVSGMLAYGAVQHPFTLFSEICSLPPGTYQEFIPATDGSWRAHDEPVPFWKYPASDSRWTSQRAISAVRDTVELAVRDHLISDVPVGLFLSAGIDSTILAGIAAKASPSMRSFTVSFDQSPETDESSSAVNTASFFGLTHDTVFVSSADAEAAARDWLASLDQPSIDGLNTYVISRAVRKCGIKVALSGLGGDELFGGYPTFRDVPRLRRLARFTNFLPIRARIQIAYLLSAHRSPHFREKLRDILSGKSDWVSLYLQRRRLLSDSQMAQLGYKADFLGLNSNFIADNSLPDLHDLMDDTVAILSRLESVCYQGNMLLRDCDANGMACGLEIRVPLLDQRILDLAHSIPGEIRVPLGLPGKFLLREAFSDLLQSTPPQRPKSGFTLPISQWMQGSLKPLCDEAIRTLKEVGIVELDGVASIQRRFQTSPNSPIWSRLFSLCVLGDFIHRNGATV